MADVYLYGMTVLSTIYRCASPLPADSGYAEVSEAYVCPGGEAMNAALLLSGLGLSTALAGPHWGNATREVLARYATRYGIDVTGISYDADFEGVRDVVLVAGAERTVLGWFGKYFGGGQRRWGEPNEAQIAAARIVAIDPYFLESSERATRLAREHGKPYVTIDCPFNSELHAGAAANVLSREYRRRHYPDVDERELLNAYVRSSHGLTIFTSGNQPIVFGRASAAPQVLEPFQVPIKSTLGAGDTFRAGVVFALLNGYVDRTCVEFAAALSALMCTRLPIADNLPSVEEVRAFLQPGHRSNEYRLEAGGGGDSR
jgi:sugar/nucleoside kinase (ribokinase family)